jgi:predicted nuclease of predicted toxin-antitoxin system
VKFKTDENLPLEAAATFREAGFNVETIWDEALSGATDEIVAARARSESRVLVTLDLDFANIQAYPPDRHAGIVVLRTNKDPGQNDHCVPFKGSSALLVHMSM